MTSPAWDAVRKRLERSALVVFLTIALLGLAIWRLESIPLSLSSALIAVAVVAGFVRVRATPKETAVGFAILGLCVLVTMIARFPDTRPAFDQLYENVGNVRFLSLGWALVLWSPWPTRLDAPKRRLSRAGELAIFAAGAVVLLLAHWRLTPDGHSGYTDEVLYVFQSSVFASGHLRASLPDELRPFLGIVYSVMSDNQIHGQYTPGWPALLAGLQTVGLFLLPWIFPALTLVGLWKCGSQIGRPAVGILAVVVLLINWQFIRWSVGYLAHGSTGCCLVWGTA
ncbi:MAG: hypothetical protein ACREOG_15915, partial [Gemmatimonadaceae bacterium]